MHPGSVRNGMAVYVTGLVLLTAAVELVIAYFIAVRTTTVPASSSSFWSVYFGAVVALVIAGAVLIPRGLQALRVPNPGAEPGPL